MATRNKGKIFKNDIVLILPEKMLGTTIDCLCSTFHQNLDKFLIDPEFGNHDKVLSFYLLFVDFLPKVSLVDTCVLRRQGSFPTSQKKMSFGPI